MITNDSIIIKRSLPEVYRIAQDIENSHTYISGYKPSKLIKTEDGEIIVERVAEIKGKIMKWKSRVEFNINKTIEFEQIEGRLKGMKILWLFEEVSDGTKLTITHRLSLNPPVIGWILAKFVAKPAIEKLTRNVLSGLKNKVENNGK